ncbi:MAG: putative DNA modification/repair radical SAM protein, partial [Vicinamibacterales bacterium]
MDVAGKLAILADAAKYDASCASSGAKRAGNGKGVGHSTGNGICHSYTPDGRCVSLLKILLTNVCIYDCIYCVNRISSDVPRARFTVAEVVTMTLDFYRRNYIEGLFLSSGVMQTPDYTMEQLVAVAKQLRETHHFGGYIHLKAMPDASPLLLAAAGRYADRVSVNIELPTPADLHRLAPDKSQAAIVGAMTELRDRIDAAKSGKRERCKPPAFAPAGQSTQMIVGATESTDSAILSTASHLYERQRLRRVYYSAYSPIPKSDAFLPAKPAPLVREHRLYQADWLLRFYGFRVD